MEVFLVKRASLRCICSLLHVRGGVSDPERGQEAADQVFSTSVEVFLSLWVRPRSAISLLHVRGGVSNKRQGGSHERRSSPRPWRCFQLNKILAVNAAVFSTSVEVFLHQVFCAGRLFSSSPRPWRCFLRLSVSRSTVMGLLHVRGGVSKRTAIESTTQLSSPRPWRCFHHWYRAWRLVRVFSTSVEVFLNGKSGMAKTYSLLHVRGGVSGVDLSRAFGLQSSPRPWRCFLHPRAGRHRWLVFSTSVEVFLRNWLATGIAPESSPRPWRYFCRVLHCALQSKVFSTSVEVFPQSHSFARRPLRLLHVRGGVSVTSCTPGKLRMSSPRPWRCF